MRGHAFYDDSGITFKKAIFKKRFYSFACLKIFFLQKRHLQMICVARYELAKYVQILLYRAPVHPFILGSEYDNSLCIEIYAFHQTLLKLTCMNMIHHQAMVVMRIVFDTYIL